MGRVFRQERGEVDGFEIEESHDQEGDVTRLMEVKMRDMRMMRRILEEKYGGVRERLREILRGGV